ncbi:MAG: hypothetical protein WB780_17045 [Candidatus Acidiferrales bacterium]
MADWRQIQARIRKAKNAQDAHAKLSELFQRTHDAMVAWELALIEEKAERTDEAARWYTIAAQRFRRAEWKKKAEEALARLGVAPSAAPSDEPGNEARPSAAEESAEAPQASLPLALGEISHIPSADGAIESHSESEAESEATSSTAEPGKKKRRRGRRGGRGRRRKRAAASPALPSQAFAEPSAPASTPVPSPAPQPRPQATTRIESFERAAPAPFTRSEPPPSRRAPIEPPAPTLPSERTAHGRAGDPALASRLAHLESMLRRLVSSPLHRLEEADEAPAGPGVFLLSDSDQISSYYVEACQTLRIGLGNLARGGRTASKGGRGRGYSSDTSGLKAKLAEHLEINEAKVSQYLKDHCVVRWIQLDDDAPLLAHFAIAVLRTPLNMD